MDMTGMYIYLCKNIVRFSLGQQFRRNYFGQDYPEHTLHVPLRMGRCLITSRCQLMRDDADHNIQTDNWLQNTSGKIWCLQLSGALKFGIASSVVLGPY